MYFMIILKVMYMRQLMTQIIQHCIIFHGNASKMLYEFPQIVFPEISLRRQKPNRRTKHLFGTTEDSVCLAPYKHPYCESVTQVADT